MWEQGNISQDVAPHPSWHCCTPASTNFLPRSDLSFSILPCNNRATLLLALNILGSVMWYGSHKVKSCIFWNVFGLFISKKEPHLYFIQFCKIIYSSELCFLSKFHQFDETTLHANRGNVIIWDREIGRWNIWPFSQHLANDSSTCSNRPIVKISNRVSSGSATLVWTLPNWGCS